MTVNKTSLVLGLALASALAACGALKGGEEIQAAVDKAVLGMAAGEFFSRYGPAYSRGEQLDQSTKYHWISRIGSAVPGPAGLDDRVCKLTVIADGRGRIVSAAITQDNPGRISTSRCTEVFTGKEGIPGARPKPDA